jgi:hypothetical protein
MLLTEMEFILSQLLTQESTVLDSPSNDDWDTLEAKFGRGFGVDFKNFISLMSKYSFPGDILNVSTGVTNGNDTIETAYDLERKHGHWKAEMIPFYAIGNGDYFCINGKESPNSPVYYYYAERESFEHYAASFDEWVRRLSTFLA